MVISRILTIFLFFTRLSSAFISTHPLLVNYEHAYYVAELPTFRKVDTQMKRVNSKSSSDKAEKPGSLSASSYFARQTEAMSTGMVYLYADSGNETVSVNITLESDIHSVLVDTGSPYLWIYSSMCEEKSCGGKILYGSNSSSKLNGSFALSYDYGIVSGLIHSDAFSIASYKESNLTFGVADNVPSFFQSYGFSGVLGLPANNLSSSGGLTNIVPSLFQTREINFPLFALCIGEYESTTKNFGILVLGSRKNYLYSGVIYSSPVIDGSQHWELEIEGIFMDGYQVTFDSTEIDKNDTAESRIGLVDSGTTFLILPFADANTVHSFFPGSVTDGENFAILCNSTVNLQFQISGKNWTLTADEYLGKEYSSSSGLGGYCVSNIQGLNTTNDGTWILGLLFMKNKYIEFDYANQTVGIADRNSNIKFIDLPSNSSTSPSESSRIMSSSPTPSAISIAKNANCARQKNVASKSHWTPILAILFLYI